jgi:thiol-disulfide isomerase/thioredoxin
MYYSYALPRDKYHTVKLGSLSGKLDADLVPDPRGEKSAEPESVVAHPPLGSEPPEVVAADWLNTDDPQSLAALRGNVVLVEFWATWCGPCVAGIPHLNELQAKYRHAGLRILSFTDQDRETVEAFQKQAQTSIEYTIGLGSNLAETYGVMGIPHAFLVGRDGKLLWHGHPASPECEVEIIAALDKTKASLE